MSKLKAIAYILTLAILASAPALAWAEAVSNTVKPTEPATFQSTIKGLVSPANLKALRKRLRLHRADMVAKFYEKYEYEQAWTTEHGPLPAVLSLTGALKKAPYEGLDPDYYHLSDLESRLSALLYSQWRSEPEDLLALAEFEVLLTDSFLSYGSDLMTGKIRPETLSEKWGDSNIELDLTAYLMRMLKLNRLGEGLDSLAPLHPGYLMLRKNLAEYREILKKGGWGTVSDTIKPGQSGPQVKQLRKRLKTTQDLAEDVSPTTSAEYFDDKLKAAVMSFQERHGIKPDGVVGKATLRELNVPVEKRLSTIEMNMERWRWIPNHATGSYILVNLTDFSLQMFEEGEPRLTMRVIVGDKFTNTPVFGTTITSISLNPSWNIPKSIALTEVVPSAAKDPDYFTKRQIKVYSNPDYTGTEFDPTTIRWENINETNFKFWLKQLGGKHNPLGRIKFVMPNKFSVYLHDTPTEKLFEKDVRTYSHGCIRLEKPMELAQKLLAGTSYADTDRLMAAMESGKNIDIPLKRRVRVELVYWTAWVDIKGVLNFRPDYYSHDKNLAKIFYRAK